MSSATIPSSQIDSNSNSSTNDSHNNITDVLLYAESKMTRKQAVREIADVVLRANMKPRTVKHALQLLKSLLPPENTLPATVNELFGAMLSSENDWRLAQYLIKHKQRPSFLSVSSTAASSSPNIWSENSNSVNSLTAASSSSISANQPLIIPSQSSPFFLPLSSNDGSGSSSSSSESSNENSSESSSASASSSSESDDDDDNDDNDDNEDEEEEEEEDDADERNILRVLQEAQQQRRANASSSSPARSSTESAEVNNNQNHVTTNNFNESSDQRSQIVSSSFNRFPFLGSFKRQRSETSSDESDSEPDLFFRTHLTDNHDDDDDDDDDSDDDETTFYSISNNNSTNNVKSRCFEMNGCDLLDGGKRRRHL